jgi:hypothetical protein
MFDAELELCIVSEGARSIYKYIDGGRLIADITHAVRSFRPKKYLSAIIPHTKLPITAPTY